MSTMDPSVGSLTGAVAIRDRKRARHPLRRTKIVCTLGPATSDPDTVEQLARMGMDAARLNFSFGSHAEHLARLEAVRAAQERLGRPLAVIADLCGPKIRLRGLKQPLDVDRGDTLTLSALDPAEPGDLAVSFAQLAEVVAPGEPVLIDDGRIRLRAQWRDGSRVRCLVEVGGTISPGKGVNLPKMAVAIPSLTEKDLVDLEFALQQGADYVALSFVQTAQDVIDLKGRIAAAGSSARVISKIEKREAVANLESIIAASDAVMVARGDLGVEIGVSEVPLVQKDMIRRAREAGKTVITATQMLESMVHSPEPTRAEASDVANAIIDGTSATMLSAETASGEFPMRAVEVMDRIARTIEPSLEPEHRGVSEAGVATILTHTACELAHEIDAALIAVPTQTGVTAREVARFQPQRPIVAASSERVTLQQLALEWAVVPLAVPPAGSLEEAWTAIVNALIKNKLASTGDVVVLTGSTQLARPGATSHVLVHSVE